MLLPRKQKYKINVLFKMANQCCKSPIMRSVSPTTQTKDLKAASYIMDLTASLRQLQIITLRINNIKEEKRLFIMSKL